MKITIFWDVMRQVLLGACLLSLLFYPAEGDVSPKHQEMSIRLHDGTSQKTVFFSLKNLNAFLLAKL
jgi:hypothetical protein